MASKDNVVQEKECTKIDGAVPQDRRLSWPAIIGCIIGALACLYVFLVGLTLMGSSFKVLGGRGAGNMYGAVENPIAGVMTGVLSTVLVQSSSTSTSIVVSMVGAGSLSVKNGIPIIMGANIGTSVTNSIVAMGQSGNRIDLERAFAGATVHDMFNMLTVLTLLPIEAIFAAIQGEGGPLYWLTHAITTTAMGGDNAEALFTSPIKTITSPAAKLILSSNKYVIYAMTLGRPQALTASAVNATLCEEGSDRRLAEAVAEAGGRSLLSRRMSDASGCQEYFCVGKGQDKNFKKISSKSYKKLTKCGDIILDGDGKPCGKDKCYLDAGAYYDKKVQDGRLIKGGFVQDAGDVGGGIIGLILSLILLSGGMIGLTKTLQIIFMTKAQTMIRYSLKMNDYLAIGIGILITIIVQSSSVTTSALTPLAGLGVLPLAKMLPLTLGANIGTTCTALIASLVSLKFGAVQIALCHLWFNIFGILIWFPVPFMRKFPLTAARLLGLYASFYRFTPPLYILVMFVFVPLIGLAVSATFDASVAGGVILLLIVLAALAAWIFFWNVGYPLGGDNALCYRVLSKEQRKQGEEDLAAANAQLQGEACSDPEKPKDVEAAEVCNDAEKPKDGEGAEKGQDGQAGTAPAVSV